MPLTCGPVCAIHGMVPFGPQGCSACASMRRLPAFEAPITTPVEIEDLRARVAKLEALTQQRPADPEPTAAAPWVSLNDLERLLGAPRDEATIPWLQRQLAELKAARPILELFFAERLIEHDGGARFSSDAMRAFLGWQSARELEQPSSGSAVAASRIHAQFHGPVECLRALEHELECDSDPLVRAFAVDVAELRERLRVVGEKCETGVGRG